MSSPTLTRGRPGIGRPYAVKLYPNQKAELEALAAEYGVDMSYIVRTAIDRECARLRKLARYQADSVGAEGPE